MREIFTICTEFIQQGSHDAEIEALRKAEQHFTREAGVLERTFYQCVQQPHILWANTRWTSEGAHNRLAQTMMKVRKDDRVASAYFRPGLYYEIFAGEISEATIGAGASGAPGYVIVAQGCVSDRDAATWRDDLAARARALPPIPGLVRCRSFFNLYCTRELVAFLEWESEEAYLAGRRLGERTIEETLLIGEKPYTLAAYVQFECRVLHLTA
ncbi:MAG: hypothetical protein IT372_16025 [Polyangiaceae bacterium]|nr:hypothetical protein [Polyangiaceae bacterium]